MIPGVKGPLASQEERDAFNESERNCNQCTFLERVKRPKETSHMLYGRCSNPRSQLDKHPYRARIEADGVFQFHADDWMGMPCFVYRRAGV